MVESLDDSERGAATSARLAPRWVVKCSAFPDVRIEAVVDIAYNATDVPVQSKNIAARQDIPRRYLEQVLQRLVEKVS